LNRIAPVSYLGDRSISCSLLNYYRYADVCVHRLLAAAIGVDPLPPQLSSKSYVHDLCDNMNRRHRSAQLAGRASVQLHTLVFFTGESGAQEVDAYVLDVDTTLGKSPSLTVMVPRFGIEGNVKMTVEADDPRLVRTPELHKVSLQSSSTESHVQVFDKVRVRIWVRQTADDQKDLVIDLVSPQFAASNIKRPPSPPLQPSQSKRAAISGIQERRPKKHRER
jgi:exosome complex exonuclease DIS3/RRP44